MWQSVQVYESSSSPVVLKLFLALIITIVISSVIFVKLTGNSHIHTYWVQGAYGSLFGIIAGPPGIAAANSKRLSRTKCLWTSHIVLVSKFNFLCAKYLGLPIDFKLIKYFRVLSQWSALFWECILVWFHHITCLMTSLRRRAHVSVMLIPVTR